MQSKKRILVTDTAPLYPPHWGGPKRIWGLCSNFSSDIFDITYVGINFNLDHGRQYIFNKLGDNFKEILCGAPAYYYLWHALEQKITHRTYLDLFSYLWAHTDSHFRYILGSLPCDIIIFSHPWSSPAICKNKKQSYIYDAHNCEYLLMERILKKRHLLKKVILGQVRKIEGEACKRSSLILACSEKERQDFIDLYHIERDKVVVIPNGADIAKRDSRNNKGEAKSVIFVGSYYKPNIDAVSFIIKNLGPKLEKFIFLITGTVCDAFKTQGLPPNIKLLGQLNREKLEAVLGAADIAINPIFDGAGVNIKMLDYMSYGLPIVTTECGARGIETKRSLPFIVSSPDDFIQNIKMLDNDSALCQRLSGEGRGLIAKRYDWKIISKRLEKIILEKL